MDIKDLIAGYETFKDKKFKKYQNRFIDLVKKGQHPKILFIACSDSRVDPSLITDASPGELFILRNVGNLVPPYSPDNDYHGTAAGIEYAVSVLKVTDIIVCGHSYCGAIDEMYHNITDPALIHVKKWLELGHPACEYVQKTMKGKVPKAQKLAMTERISVVFQLANLLTYPEVSRKVDLGELSLRGWYYKIKKCELEYYDDATMTFKPMISDD